MLLSNTLSKPYVTQVIVKQTKSTINDLTTYFMAQNDITKTIENILMANIVSPLPPTIIVEGKGYSLHGVRKEWTYGKGLRLTWGEQEICTCDDKWVFVFDPTPVE